MKLLVYKDGMCDPKSKMGTALEFPNNNYGLTRIDQFMQRLVASTKPSGLHRFRAFVVNDNIGFEETDNIINVEETLTLKGKEGVRELDLMDYATEIRDALKKREQMYKERKERLQNKIHTNLEQKESPN